MSRRLWLVRFVALIVLANGVLNLLSLVRPVALPLSFLDNLLSLPLVPPSRLVTLLTGLALSATALNVWRRRRLAWWVALGLALASLAAHLGKTTNQAEALASLLLLAALLYTRPYFTGQTARPNLRHTLLRLGLILLAALVYGVAGFWFLDPRQFGRAFQPGPALVETLRHLALVGDPDLTPQTAYARWFLASFDWVTAFLLAYVLYSLFRPLAYEMITQPQDRRRAAALLADYGRSAVDTFKLWPDKSYFFSGNTFLAYGVAHNFAVVLGDPVGPQEEIAAALAEFSDFCGDNGWRAGFHNTLPDFLPLYEALGFRSLKIGDEAVVDLTAFTLAGKAGKNRRSVINRIERDGIRTELTPPPLPEALIAEAQEVADEWLQIPGRRERGFTLGRFTPAYVRQTPLFAARDAEGRMLGFVNLIPSYRPGEATADLMRRRQEIPNGLMDYIFIKLFEYNQAQGFRRFSLGLAPMSGFQPGETPSREERAVHALFRRLDFLFSFSGLKQYKAKYASTWEPRYVVYRSPLDLPRLERALNTLSHVPAEDRSLWQRLAGARRFPAVTLDLLADIARRRAGAERENG